MRKDSLGKVIFKLRSYTPIPFLIAALVWSGVTWTSYLFGLSLVLGGEGLRLWAVSYAGPMTRMKNVGASRLLSNGPFAYTRNPLYCGNFILGCGFCVMSWALMPWLFVAFVITFFAQYSLIVSHEEKFLVEKFGGAYYEYSRNVPRVIPRLKPYEKKEGPVPSLLRGLRSEKRTLQTIFLISLVFFIRRFSYS